jgi:lipopolysaccharide transport system ATP-binding protein
MSDVVLHAEQLSKRYRIGVRQERYRTARDAVSSVLAAPFRRRSAAQTALASEAASLWALKDVSFQVAKGEVVGVIGRNGAGKSTLLKILSRITEPTSGFADIRGRVGSLLEVGSGFHLELTGRENIFLNAAILGMHRNEVLRKFDEIVEFAEVGRFIDTPVKHYSSGMHLRLAFSVAAHLEPEILLIDEVLAVGDAAFQKKCLGKMEDVATHGRTVLFVSHSLGAVRELCQTCIVMDGGRLAFRGPVLEGLACYSETMRHPPAREHGSTVAWTGVHINGGAPGDIATIGSSSPLAVGGWLALRERLAGGTIICLVEDSVGNAIVNQRAIAPIGWECPMEAGLFHVSAELPALWLAPGAYSVYFKFMARLDSGSDSRVVSERVLLEVEGTRTGLGRAILAPEARWSIRPDTNVRAREEETSLP